MSSQDLKLANIVVGIQSHSVKYPCVYGECTQDPDTGVWIPGKLRTVENISENRRQWLLSGGNRESLMNYKNCGNEPLLSNVNPSTPILVQLPPPPLHTILLDS